ncbi:MAG: hypothetical protein HY360_10205 [Verrucomicrobia bacterium]|nr:hypothetical protein [Verrucomicrobiota bacterium]
MKLLVSLLAIILWLAAFDLPAAENLLRNPGFEELNADETFPLEWNKYYKRTGDYRVRIDKGFSRQGQVCLQLSEADERPHPFVALRSNVVIPPHAKREYTFAVYAKGRGELRFAIDTHAEADGRRDLKPVESEWVDVVSDKWQRFSANLTVLEETLHMDGSRPLEAVKAVSLVIQVKGEVWLDDAFLAEGHDQIEREQKTDRNPSQTPLVTINQSRRRPQIDGNMAPEEWADACAVTGFFELMTPCLAERQTVCYLTYDAQHLYLAFRSLNEAGAFRTGKGAPGQPPHSEEEGLEVWLQPPGQAWFQLTATPAGSVYLGCSKKSESEKGGSWKATPVYRSKVDDSGETVNGVLTFNKKIWTAELAIPFKDLGVAAPKDGEIWRMNFCRDFSVEPGKSRSPQDWTSWSFTAGGFAKPQQFGFARFVADSPALQLRQFGDLADGQCDIQGATSARQPARLRLSMQILDAQDRQKRVLEKNRLVQLDPGKSVEFALGDVLKLTARADLVFQFTAEDVVGKTALYQVEMPFTAAPAFRLQLKPFFTRRLLFLECDATRLGGLPAAFKGRLARPSHSLAIYGRSFPLRRRGLTHS